MDAAFHPTRTMLRIIIIGVEPHLQRCEGRNQGQSWFSGRRTQYQRGRNGLILSRGALGFCTRFILRSVFSLAFHLNHGHREGGHIGEVVKSMLISTALKISTA